MRKNTINKIILPYLLSGIFILPFIVKSLHVYDISCQSETHQCADDHASSSSKHDCKTCLICQFTLSYFIDPELSNQTSLLFSFNIERTTAYKEKQYFAATPSHYLRAPPQYSVQLYC